MNENTNEIVSIFNFPFLIFLLLIGFMIFRPKEPKHHSQAYWDKIAPPHYSRQWHIEHEGHVREGDTLPQYFK